MPFTPYHFGPGLLVKAFVPRSFHLMSFLTANVLIDVEVLYYLYRRDPPVHRYFHTYLGGIVLGLIAGLLMFAFFEVLQRVTFANRSGKNKTASVQRPRLLVQSILAGVFSGVLHIFLDSLMHSDMHPFWPFARGNVLAGTVSVDTLHISLALSGLLGLFLWLLLRATKFK